MLEWEVLEEEAALPSADAGPTRPGNAWRRRVGQGLLLLLLLGMSVVGTARWQQYRQAKAVRDEIAAVVAVEARLKAMGEWEQARALLDPSAPLEWKNAYLYHLSLAHPLPGVPRVQQVELDETGEQASLWVQWPTSGSPATERASLAPPATERRAYRLVEGQWRRTPLRESGGQVEERASDYFVLRGDPVQLDLLQDEGWRFDPEALRHHLATWWPGDWLEPRPITLLVEWQEFGPVAQKTPSRRTLRINSPQLSYRSGDGPLGSDAYYRLHLTDHSILKILPVQRPEELPLDMDEEAGARYVLLQRQLQWAEARGWALDESERAALRAGWRATLGEAWSFPLRPDALPRIGTLDAERTRHWMAMNLLLDYLIARDGAAVPGRLARSLATEAARAPLDAGSAQRIFERVSGNSMAELEQQLRAFVME